MNTGIALVTGASGFVGSNLTRLLLDSGRDVHVIIRPQSDRRNIPENPHLKVFVGDLKDPMAVKKAVSGCSEVYHVAADYRFWAKNPQEIYDNNVKGTEVVALAAADAGVARFIHTSTVGTIGLACQPNPANEESAFDDGQLTSHYKKSKLAAEKLVLDLVKQGLPAVVVNPSTPIGPWDRKPTPTGQIIVDFANGRMPAYVETGLNFIDVRGVAKGHVLAAEKGRIGERYILAYKNLRMIEFLNLLGNQLRRSVPRVRIPYRLAWMTGVVSTAYADHISKKMPRVPLEAVKMSKRFMYFDASKAVKELGLPQTPIETAIEDALNWFSKNNYFER